MRKKLIIALFVFAAAAAGLFWTTRSENGKVAILETQSIKRGEVRRLLEATGIVKAQVGAIVKIGAQATGRIEQMHVKVGDTVQKGDLIAEIDNRELSAAKTEAQARVERTRAELQRIRKTYPLRVAEAEAELESAQAELRYAESFAKRQSSLAQADLIARDTLDDAVRQAKVKAGAVRARKAALDRLSMEFTEERKKAERSLVEAKAALATATTRLSHTRIFSPITGLVSQVAAQEGETVVTGLEVANLITVLDPTRLEMWIYVDETDVGQVEQGMPVEFQVDAYPDRTFHGSISQIYPQPEIRDNIVYFQALVTLDGKQAQSLRPEMTTQCRIIVETRQNVLAMPNAALKWVDGKQVVYVKDGESHRTVHPELGLQGISRSQVMSGLSEGDEVAVRVSLSSDKTAKRN